MADERAVHYDPQWNSSPGRTGRRSSFLPSAGSRFPLFFLFLFSFLCVFGPFPTVSSSSTLLAPHYFEYKLRKKKNSELWPFLQPKTIGHASSSQGQNEMKREKRREEEKKKRERVPSFLPVSPLGSRQCDQCCVSAFVCYLFDAQWRVWPLAARYSMPKLLPHTFICHPVSWIVEFNSRVGDTHAKPSQAIESRMKSL